MASPPCAPQADDPPEIAVEDSPAKPASSPHHKMSARSRFLIFLTAWLIVLMPFLFWWNTWFGRRLTDKQFTDFLMMKSTRGTSSTRLCNWASAWGAATRQRHVGIRK